MNPTMMMKWGRPRGRKKPTHCDHPECNQATRESKPYCSDHVEELPYVREVQARIEAREAELSALAKKGSRGVDVHGIVARDVLCSLWTYGERSVARLSRELNVDFELLLHVVAKLKKAKQITQTNPRRGAGKVALVPALAEIDDPRKIGLRPEVSAPVLATPLAMAELAQVRERQASCGGAG